MELNTGLTLLSVVCTGATVYYTFTSKKYFTVVQEYFQTVKKHEINNTLKVAAAEMKKFGAGCTEASLKGLSPKSHSTTCSKVQDVISELRRNQKSLRTKSFKVDEIVNELDNLLLIFSRIAVVETSLLMTNDKPLYDKLNELESHFDPSTSIPTP
ncbi:hypothetical protein AY606_09280 [Acinetobacter sp. SFB]|uniref:hypothetical protein n=1 Tax=Acinetobacter sp. SFB TaxID=1805634 RepID=UPI0007D7EE60|nr:hypothetical protein [Acinetobacter sp. SFB]OAL78593.1 hypothetical protein AY606_09280 [Acinetobacter sp. SFB]